MCNGKVGVMSSLCLCSVIHKTFLRFNIAETASKSQGDIKRLKRADTAESGGGKVQSLNVHLSYVSASAVLIKVSAKFRCDFHNILRRHSLISAFLLLFESLLAFIH